MQFLAVPVEAETCGPVIHDHDGSVFVAVQHPGEDGSWAAQTSFFPDYVSAGQRPRRGEWRGPRPSVVHSELSEPPVAIATRGSDKSARGGRDSVGR